ncbi:hypothetical protein [Streptomyces sp. CAI-85]|uniref:hypothetical protein n=1 Tax=Streptomyces sp. CAI-85 TaxID=1472662 RepID=UPI00158725ED|nr:hypothetical protein [Streptomyces sp. CAI-85]NUV64299.1 hypothetical protein [Streptomyces sp. CAI-85]
MPKRSKFAAAAASGVQRTGADRAALPVAPADPADAVRALVEQLPALDDVREVAEDDDSPLTPVERAQKDTTEHVIEQAAQSANAAVWIVAQALERAAKGRWWRGEYATYDAYVQSKVNRSASYVRRLRSAAPLALETAQATGFTPNEGQAREQRKAEQRFGTRKAVALFGAVVKVAAEVGGTATAARIADVRDALPAELADLDDDQAATVIERTARTVLGVPIGPPADDGGPIGTPGDDGEIVDAELVEDPLDAVRDALRGLRGVNKGFSRATLREVAEHPEYAKLHAGLLSAANAVRNKVAQVPPVERVEAVEG